MFSLTRTSTSLNLELFSFIRFRGHFQPYTVSSSVLFKCLTPSSVLGNVNRWQLMAKSIYSFLKKSCAWHHFLCWRWPLTIFASCAGGGHCGRCLQTDHYTVGRMEPPIICQKREWWWYLTLSTTWYLDIKILFTALNMTNILLSLSCHYNLCKGGIHLHKCLKSHLNWVYFLCQWKDMDYSEQNHEICVFVKCI